MQGTVGARVAADEGCSVSTTQEEDHEKNIHRHLTHHHGYRLCFLWLRSFPPTEQLH